MFGAYSHYLHHWMSVYQQQSLKYGLSFLILGSVVLVGGYLLRDRISGEPLGRSLVTFSGVAGVVSGALILTGAWTLLWWAQIALTLVIPALVLTLAVVSLADAFRPRPKSPGLVK